MKAAACPRVARRTAAERSIETRETEEEALPADRDHLHGRHA